MSKDKPFSCTYRFQSGKGEEKVFELQLDEALNLLQPKNQQYPAWTKLTHCQCPRCPLKATEHPHCPVAVNLIPVVEHFEHSVSIEVVDVVIETPHRTYSKHVPLQKGLSALLGIYMVTNTCPVMAKLKPMVQFHLPFATAYETFYRSISMYLTAQYFFGKQGGAPDWDLAHFTEMYDDVRMVNKCFSERLMDELTADAGLNALVILDCFAQTALFDLDVVNIKKLEDLFHSHFEELP